MEQLSSLEVPEQTDPTASFTNMLLDQEAREKVRTGAQELLAVIGAFNEADAQTRPMPEPQNEAEEKPATIQDAAQAALEKLTEAQKEDVEDA